MATAVIMPKAGISVESCIITEWLKKPGDKVAIGDILFSYETDKASFECESTAEGVLLEIFYGNGDEVPVLVNVCTVGNPG
jgi:pyruvate/2-oxoglutarate dehydrogenase complex dihydrolipoamide acyltransferase (E2) component